MSMGLTLERAKGLLVNLIEDLKGSNVSDEDDEDIEDTINYLFALDFTEEDLLELEVCTEEQIDSANERLN